MSNISRRDFLKLTRNGLLYLSGALALGGLIRFLNFQTDPAPKTEFDLGLASNYPLDSRTLLAEIPALLLHSVNGFTAISLVCTHLGCTVEQNTEGFSCPCHASRFDPQGNVSHGPASKPLRGLRVELSSDGHLWLYANE